MALFISSLAAILLTLAILSFLIADNPLYRVAVNLFVGLAAGYAVVMAWYGVLYPQLMLPLRTALTSGASLGALLAQLLVTVLAAALGLLLLLKTARAASRLGSLVVAFMVGVGAAVAVGGAITGTLLPQADAAAGALAPGGLGAPAAGEALLEGLFVLVGTVATLGFFYYGAQAEPGSPPQRPAWVRPFAGAGQVFIGIAFGVMYAGALAASLAVFAERSAALWGFFGGLF